MGTNFYLMTKSKELKEKYFGYNCELTDTPFWGYQIHIAKTSAGWLPLFQKHNCIQSVKDIEKLYFKGFLICDEYGTSYGWEEFTKRVLQHNGGIKDVIKRELKEDPWDGTKIYYPISHFDSAYAMERGRYFVDEEGYEFTDMEFN